jgi:AcrR family transcriptional regulator
VPDEPRLLPTDVKATPRKVDAAAATKARSMRVKGINATDIAKMVGVSRATVYRYLATDTAA